MLYEQLRCTNTPNRQLAQGVSIYSSGTPEKTSKPLGQWLSHSGGAETAMKPGKYEVDTKRIPIKRARRAQSYASQR